MTTELSDLSGISLPLYALFTLGVALWMTCGLVIGRIPILPAMPLPCCWLRWCWD